MGVELKRDGRGCVSQPLRDRLEVSAALEKQRRRTVPERVENDPRDARLHDQRVEGPPKQIALPDRAAVAIGEHEPFDRGLLERQQTHHAFVNLAPLALFSLGSSLVFAELGDCEVGEGDGSPTRLSLEIRELVFPANFDELTTEMDGTRIKVDVVPFKSEQLTLTSSGRQSENVQRFEPIALDRVQK